MRKYYAIYKVAIESMVSVSVAQTTNKLSLELASDRLYLKLEDAESALNMLPKAQYIILPFYQPYVTTE